MPSYCYPTAQVVREGEVNLKLFFIHRGTVAVWKGYLGAVEQRTMLATLSANDFFGETSLMKQDDHVIQERHAKSVRS